MRVHSTGNVFQYVEFADGGHRFRNVGHIAHPLFCPVQFPEVGAVISASFRHRFDGFLYVSRGGRLEYHCVDTGMLQLVGYPNLFMTGADDDFCRRLPFLYRLCQFESVGIRQVDVQYEKVEK